MSFSRAHRAAFFAASLLLTLFIGACASSPGPPGSERPARSDLISREDLQELTRMNAFQAIQLLQPQWLRVRGVDSFFGSNEVVVYLDGVRRGGPDVLRGINTVNLQEIRRLDSRQATTQFGTGHPSGAILLITYRP